MLTNLNIQRHIRHGCWSQGTHWSGRLTYKTMFAVYMFCNRYVKAVLMKTSSLSAYVTQNKTTKYIYCV